MTTKLQFLDKVKRRLGHGAVKVHVTDPQLEDAYLRGLDYYYKIVPDATDVVYYKYQVTQQDVDNNTNIITLPPEIHDVREMLIGRSTGISFNGGYTTGSFGNGVASYNSTYGGGYEHLGLASYYVSVQYMNMLRNLFSPSDLFYYSRFTNKMQLQLQLKSDVGVGGYILFLVDVLVDPSLNTDIHKDELFVGLVSAYVEEQQARNFSKFSGVSLPGGVKFDVEKLKSKADEDIKEFEKKIYDYYSPGCGIFLI